MSLGDVGFSAMTSDTKKIHSGIKSIDDLLLDRREAWDHVDAEPRILKTLLSRLKHFAIRNKAFSNLKGGSSESIAVPYLKIRITSLFRSRGISLYLLQSNLVAIGMRTIAQRRITYRKVGQVIHGARLSLVATRFAKASAKAIAAQLIISRFPAYLGR